MQGNQRPLLAQGRAAMAKGRTEARLIRKGGREHRGRQWMRNFRNLGLDMASRPFNKGWACFAQPGGFSGVARKHSVPSRQGQGRCACRLGVTQVTSSSPKLFFDVAKPRFFRISLPCFLGRRLSRTENVFFERSIPQPSNAQGLKSRQKNEARWQGRQQMLPKNAIAMDGGAEMSGFGSDLCPGDPCSLSLDHNFYASECAELPPAPFNTLDSDYSEEPLFSLDPDYVAIGTSSWEESPLCSSPVADRVQISPPEPKPDASLPSPPRSQQCPGPMHLEEPVSSPPSLLHLYLTRKSRRVRAAPQTTTPVLDGCVLAQVPDEQVPPTSSSIGVAATSCNKVLCDVDSVKDVSTLYGRSDGSNAEQGHVPSVAGRVPDQQCRLDGDNDLGNLGDGRECEEDVGCSPLLQVGSSPFHCPATMQQESASSEGLNTHASSVPRGLTCTVQKACVANSSSRGVTRAKFNVGEVVPQPLQPMPTREDGWRCPRAQKRQKRARQSRLDGWIVEGSPHQA